MTTWGRDTIGIELIGGLKLLKAILLVLSAPLVHFIGKHQMTFLYAIVQHVNVDPHARYFQEFVRRFVQLSPKFPLISIGMFAYGAVFFVEGLGLVLQRRWAEYLTVIVTASFLPLEIYEMIHRSSVTKGVVIVANFAILLYLILHLQGKRKDRRVYGGLPATNAA